LEQYGTLLPTAPAHLQKRDKRDHTIKTEETHEFLLHLQAAAIINEVSSQTMHTALQWKLVKGKTSGLFRSM
jgi:hypothetical protein